MFLRKYKSILMITAVVLLAGVVSFFTYLKLHRYITWYFHEQVMQENCDQSLYFDRNDWFITAEIYVKDNETIDKIRYIFLDKKNEQLYELVLDGKQWVRLYFQTPDYVQVQYMLRTLNDKNKDRTKSHCDLYKQLIYLTGVVPSNVSLIYSDKIISFQKTSLKFLWLLDHTNVKNIETTPHTAILEDGTKIDTISFNDIFSRIKDFIAIDQVVNEGVLVEIYNATDKNGYATFWSKVLNGMGFDVVRVGTLTNKNMFTGNKNNESDIKQSTFWLYIDPKVKNLESVKILKKLLGDNVYISDTRPYGVVSTADVVIVLVR